MRTDSEKLAKIKGSDLSKPEIKEVKPHNIFTVKSLTQTVSEEVKPSRKLIGTLMYEHELSILFGKTNTGKTVLAMQMGKAIAEGTNLNLDNSIVLENECGPLTVIFFDFELSQIQIQNRYSNFNVENFHRAELKPDEFTSHKPLEMIEQLKVAIDSVGAKVVIVDNISAISSEIENADNAIKFIQGLKRLVQSQGLSILIIGHPTKIDDFIPLTENHLSGSSKLAQLSDSITALGKVNTDSGGEAYIIHLKGRNDEFQYHRGNVIHTKIDKVNGNLMHIGQGTSHEMELLTDSEKINESAPNRELFAIVNAYYGSLRKGVSALEVSGHKVQRSTFSDNVRKFKQLHADLYAKFEGMTDDDLKSLLDQKSHNVVTDTLPYKDGHSFMYSMKPPNDKTLFDEAV